MRTRVESAGDIMGGQHRADREAAAKRLGAGQNIRRHAVMHIGKQRACAPHTALYFIKHQQCLVLVAEIAQSLQEFRRRCRHSAFTLNRLDHHRAGMIVHHGFHRV